LQLATKRYALLFPQTQFLLFRGLAQIRLQGTMRQTGVNFLLRRIEVSIHKYTASWIYYYLCSPQIVNHEREHQPWRQFTMKDGLDVLFAIVSFAVRAHFAMSAAETSVLAPRAVTNDTIAAVYLRPDTVSNGLQRNFCKLCKISIAILLISMALTIVRKLPVGCSF
jgi:hypothetical protein